MPDVLEQSSEQTTSNEALAKLVVRRKHFLSPLVTEVIAGASSLAVGGITAWQHIGELAHKNLSTLNLTEDIKEERSRFGLKIRNEVKAGLITEAEANAKIQGAVKLFETKMQDRFSKAGVDSLWKKFGILRGHQKSEVIIASLATGGIALGSVLLVAKELFPEKENKDTPAR